MYVRVCVCVRCPLTWRYYRGNSIDADVSVYLSSTRSFLSFCQLFLLLSLIIEKRFFVLEFLIELINRQDQMG